MIDSEKLKSLQKIPEVIKNAVLKQIKALKDGVVKRDLWYMKFLKQRVPFLQFLDDTQLTSLGRIILDNLTKIKTYNGLVLILKSVYGSQSVVVFTSEPALLEIEIIDAQKDFEYLITKHNEFITQKTGGKIILKGYGNSYDIANDFLTNFILAGVHLQPTKINDDDVIRVLQSNNNILLSGSNLLTKKGVKE